MALFDDAWMKGFQTQWNADPALKAALAKINFDSVIGYGFPDNKSAQGFIAVENGICTAAGAYDGRELNWDLRAEQKNWEKWLTKEIGMTGLGLAFSTGKLKFKKGDFKALISDPHMAGPFIKSFGAMGRV
jgi:putative sterol carrier protein